MTNPLAIGPSVMINRLAEQKATSPDTLLAKVAELRLDLETALNAQASQAPQSDQPAAPVLDNGATVDRLI